MRMLATAVSELDRLDDIVPDIQNLGRRHVVYGERPTLAKTMKDAAYAGASPGA